MGGPGAPGPLPKFSTITLNKDMPFVIQIMPPPPLKYIRPPQRILVATPMGPRGYVRSLKYTPPY